LVDAISAIRRRILAEGKLMALIACFSIGRELLDLLYVFWNRKSIAHVLFAPFMPIPKM